MNAGVLKLSARVVAAGGLVTLAWARSGAAEAGPCQLMMSSRPKGATVFVDGKERGQTPLVVKGLSTGSHTLRVVLAGHKLWMKTIRFRPGPRIVSAELEKAAGPASPAAAKEDPSAPKPPKAVEEQEAPKDAATGEARGEQKAEAVPRYVEADCDICEGTGLLKTLGCSNCKGKGYVGGNACRTCAGNGKSDYPCPACGGNSVVVVEGRGQSCRACAAKGYTPCLACRGKGKIRLSNPKAAGVPTQLCRSCDASGRDKRLVKCRPCGGAGSREVTHGGGGGIVFISTMRCRFCDGKGRARPQCPQCHGHGYVRRRVQLLSGEKRAPCQACFGTGSVVSRCRDCRGRGWLKTR